MKLKIRSRGPLRVLDFDIEVRPLSYYAGDLTSGEITAIACRWIGQPRTYCWALGEVELPKLLDNFLKKYDEADIVTGHYIRGFDLPVINGALLEQGLPPLADKLTQDTKGDLAKFSKLSKSQENLGSTLGLSHPKVTMNQDAWRQGNRLTSEGIALTKRRVVGDVAQHIELRRELLRRGYLSEPKWWRSNGARIPSYEP